MDRFYADNIAIAVELAKHPYEPRPVEGQLRCGCGKPLLVDPEKGQIAAYIAHFLHVLRHGNDPFDPR